MEKKTLILGLTATCLSIGLTVLLLEILFRFLPVPTGMAPLAVTHEDPVARFTPNQDFVWSDEWNFAITNKGHINNAGFVNDQDYAADDPRPLLAVIGDSFIEAAMVPYVHTVQGRLAAKAAPNKRVYSFAASGAPMSQYLIWAKYAHDNYKPQAMAFLIVGNDFDESLPKYVLHQIFHQFVADDNGFLQPTLLQEFHPSWWRGIIKSSALARYTFYNLNIWLAWDRIKQQLTNKELPREQAFAGNTSASMDEQRMEDSRAVVDAFFRLLPEYSQMKPRDIAFIIDSSRGWIYTNDPVEGKKNYFDEIRAYFIRQARSKGYTVVDMDGPFAADYKIHHQKFEYPTDGHWNDAAHGIAAEALENTAFFKRFINR